MPERAGGNVDIGVRQVAGVHAEPPEVGGVFLVDVLDVVAADGRLAEGCDGRRVPLGEDETVPPRPVGVLHVVADGILPERGHHIADRQVAANVDHRLVAQVQQTQLGIQRGLFQPPDQ